MPELPEVEVTRQRIDGPVRDARVLAVRMGKPLRWPLGCEPSLLVGRRVGPVLRRGKYLWLPLDEVPAASSPAGLLLHLGMSGALSWLPVAAASPAGPHDHFDLQTDRGTLRLTDPRRFGAVVYSAGLHVPPASNLLARLGPEPFDAALTGPIFHAHLQGRRSPIKQVLLGGQAVVGAGNIYACEALFRARIDPRAPADRISLTRAQRLLEAVREVLGQAVALGGSTLRDFHDPHGMDGRFQASAQVYGREGQPCVHCARPVKRLVQGQRSTFHCSHCQRR
jgi:formamidopyrimidine-DNA glycosylase